MSSHKTLTQTLSVLFRLYRRCLEITSNVLEKNELPDYSTLSEIFKRRTSILNKVKKLEKELELEQGEGKALLAGLEGRSKQKAEGLLTDLRSIMTDLIESDQKLKKRLEEEMELTSRELSRLHQGESILKAYTPFKGGISYYVNHLS